MAIEFYSAFAGSRPIRLCEATRSLADQAVRGRYGRELDGYEALDADRIPGFGTMNDRQRYDAMIRLIAERAPLRMMEGELLVGSATLKGAIDHIVPVYRAGKAVAGSVSHLTCGFDRLLREGLDAYETRIRERLASADEGQRPVLESFLNVCACIRIWHGRYMELLRMRLAQAGDEAERNYYRERLAVLEPVPFAPPENFRQGLQALWFAFAFVRLCGNWPGIGRIDAMLGPLLQKDLRLGLITLDEAREWMAHFFIKGCEWVRVDTQNRGSGDGQHYQNLVLAGLDEAGRETANEVTRLVLEVVEELPIGDFPIAVKLREDSPDWLLELVCRVIRHGSGVAAVYNENLVVQALVEFGYSLQEARRFANDGCWEVQLAGQTYFAYRPMDAYGPFQQQVLGLPEDEPDYDSFEALYERTLSVLYDQVDDWQRQADGFIQKDRPASVVGLLTDDCIDRGKDYFSGGARYNVYSPHMGGIPDIVNSLYAIKKLVFEEKRLSFRELMAILKADWEGDELLRQYALHRYSYFGNDNDEVDALASDLTRRYIDRVRLVKERCGVLRPAGISTFGRQIEWAPDRAATAFGQKKGAILSGNLNPTPGTDVNGATAIIRSHCKADLRRLTCGTALDIKLDTSALKGAAGVPALQALILGFIRLGGFFMQIDVMDNEVLKRAQAHPEEYQTLAVRISGWSARFVTLDEAWQRMIIERSAQRGC